MTEQRWLTLDMISATLRLPKSYINTLTDQGFLVCIGRNDKRRWLDPTPEYAEKLYLAAVLHRKANFVPLDISELGLLTVREIAVIVGWSMKYARIYMAEHRDIPRLKINSQMHLFTIKDIREILWRRQGRKLSKQRSPFLIQRLVELFHKQVAEDAKDIPTDAEYLFDDVIQRKLEAIVRRSESEKFLAQQDFASKIELARKVVQILEWAKLSQGDARPEPHTPLPAVQEPRQ